MGLSCHCQSERYGQLKIGILATLSAEQENARWQALAEYLNGALTNVDVSVHAYDFKGNQVWHRNLQEDHGEYTIWWGHANSPVFYENLVISVCMQDSCADLGGPPLGGGPARRDNS